MSVKNNKKYLMSGILFAVAFALYFLYVIFINFEAWGDILNILSLDWRDILTVLCLLLPVNSLMFGSKKIRNIIYFIALGLLTSIYIVSVACGEVYENPFSWILIFVTVPILFITKITGKKWLAIMGLIVVILLVISQTYDLIDSAIRGLPYFQNAPIPHTAWFLMDLSYIVESIAFYIFSIADCDTATSKKIQETSQEITLEEKLMSLKRLYDSGIITEQEYNEKKSELLNDF